MKDSSLPFGMTIMTFYEAGIFKYAEKLYKRKLAIYLMKYQGNGSFF